MVMRASNTNKNELFVSDVSPLPLNSRISMKNLDSLNSQMFRRQSSNMSKKKSDQSIMFNAMKQIKDHQLIEDEYENVPGFMRKVPSNGVGFNMIGAQPMSKKSSMTKSFSNNAFAAPTQNQTNEPTRKKVTLEETVCFQKSISKSPKLSMLLVPQRRREKKAAEKLNTENDTTSQASANKKPAKRGRKRENWDHYVREAKEKIQEAKDRLDEAMKADKPVKER